jgi:hypothetical protein
MDVFTQIADGADTLPILARATGIAENRLVTLLTALKSLGLIAESDGHFTNAPATARYLVAGAPGDFRDYVRLVNGAFGYEMHYAARMVEGLPLGAQLTSWLRRRISAQEGRAGFARAKADIGDGAAAQD